MKKGGIVILIVGLALFAAGLVIMGHSGAGILLLIAGIGAMIFGSVLLMGLSGSMKAHYFDNGRTHCSDQPSIKYDLEQEKPQD